MKFKPVKHLAALALAAASISIHAQTPAVGQTFELLAGAGPDGSAIFNHSSLYAQPITGRESAEQMQALNEAAQAVNRQACAISAAELGGRHPKLFAYKFEILEVQTFARQTRGDPTGARHKPQTWVRVVVRPRPACTGWLRLESNMRLS